MSLRSWLRTLSATASARPRSARHRPLLEALEDRTVMDVSDTLQHALNTHLGPAVGAYTMSSEQLGDGNYGALDVDLYQFKANAGEVLTATTSLPTGGTPVDTYLRLFDANGNEVANNNDYNNVNQYSQIRNFVFGASGTYYIGVSGTPNAYYDPSTGGSGQPYYTPGTGNYRLDLNLFNPTPDAAGDTLATAQATGLGPTDGTFGATASIGDGLYFNADVDLYQINAAAGQVLTAQTSLPAGGVAMDTILSVFDASGNRVTYNDDYNGVYSRVTYQFGAAGTYYVGVSSASSYNPNVGGSASLGYSTGDYQINLTLTTPTADAEGDTIASALATNLGPADGTYSHTAHVGDGLYPLKDVDLYQINAAAGQVMTATTALPSGGTSVSTYLRLFDATGTALGFTIFGYNNRFQYQFATAGTYYVGVSGYPNSSYNPNVGGSGSTSLGSGDYTLNVALGTPTADAAGDSLASAVVTGLGPANGSFSATAHIGDGLHPLRDVDLYQIQASAGQGLTAATSPVSGGAPLTADLELFDAAGNRVANNTGNPSAPLLYIFPTAGTYYVGVSGSGNLVYDTNNPAPGGTPVGGQGDYHLNLNLVTAATDAAGDTLATALATGFGPTDGTATLATNAQIGDNFWGNRDVDLYQFQGTAGQRLTATTVETAPFYYAPLRLFDAAGHQLYFTYNYLSSTIQNFTLPATGTYYLGVSGYGNFNYTPTVAGSGLPAIYTGTYSLTATLFTPTPDAEGDTIGTALATGLGPTAGTYDHTARIGDGLYPQDDVDLYRIDVNALQFLRVMTSQPPGGTLLNPVVRLFDAAGNELAFTYGFGNVTLEYQFSAAGTYYLGVSGYYNRSYNPLTANSGFTGQQIGDYHLNLTLVTPTPDAEGDTLATAVATGLGSADGAYSHTAQIGDGLYFSKDVDLYQFTAAAGQVVTALTSLPDGGTPMVPYLRLFDAGGNELANGYDLLDYHITAAGTYSLGISGAPNTNYDPTVGGSGQFYYTPSTGDYRLDLSLVTPAPDVVGDTIATAFPTAVGPGAGTFTMPDTVIGDGLWVGRDVDMYQFRSQAGLVLTATGVVLPTSATPADLLLTLYDAAGNELYQADGYGSPSTQFQITLPDHGTYYLGVSAAPNYYYDPNTAGSGSIGGRGDYSVTLRLDKLVNAPVGGGGQHVQQVTGHAVWTHTTGLPMGGQNINQVSINAWLDSSGTAHGTMTWSTVDHTLPDQGNHARGEPYMTRVDTLIIVGNTIHVEGVVVRSGQYPAAIGARVMWDIVINPDGTDTLNGTLTDGGTFTIH
jgi:hypothetical protein